MYHSVNQGIPTESIVIDGPGRKTVRPFMSIFHGKFDVMTECMPLEAMEITPRSPNRHWVKIRDPIDAWEVDDPVSFEVREKVMVFRIYNFLYDVPVEFFEDGRMKVTNILKMEEFIRWEVKNGTLRFYKANKSFWAFSPMMAYSLDSTEKRVSIILESCDRSISTRFETPSNP